MSLKALLLAVVLSGSVQPLYAACPQELAVYQAANGDGLEFTGLSDAELKFHQITLLLKDGPILDAYVEQNFDTGAPEIKIQVGCPDGDLTEADLKDCTVYRSEIHAALEDGSLIELPVASEAAARAIVLPDFAASIWQHAAFDGKGPKTMPAERFELTGCLE